MSKKMICLLLSALMLLGMFAGCSSGDKDDEDVNAVADTEESARSAMTLSLWLPTDEGTTQEAIDLVSEEINKLTTAKFDTAIELHLIPRSEYWAKTKEHMDEITEVIQQEEEAAEAKRKAIKAAKAKGITLERDDTGTVKQCSVGMNVLADEYTW